MSSRRFGFWEPGDRRVGLEQQWHCSTGRRQGRRSNVTITLHRVRGVPRFVHGPEVVAAEAVMQVSVNFYYYEQPLLWFLGAWRSAGRAGAAVALQHW